MTIMNECDDSIDSTTPVRQGDVIEWLGDHQDPWSQHAIVVTADCDITHGKHAGLLSCVPVLRHEDYLALFLLPARLEGVRERLFERARERIRALQRTNRPEYPSPLSDGAIDRWISDVSASDILSTLRISDERDPLHAIAARILDCTDALRTSVLTTQLGALTHAQLLVAGGGDYDDRLRRTVRELLDRLKSLPGDAIFIHCLSPAKTDGYVAHLRTLLNVHDYDIARNVLDLQNATVIAKRVSRLTSPYVFRLTQQLGYVFSAIGLPSAYEDSRLTFIDSRVGLLGKLP